LVSHQRITGES
ncbi:AAA domain family protein, partial [Vibrio parahaemolyticus V-223/04]